MLRFEILNSREIDNYVGNPNSMIIDVRPESEYKKKHILNAINIPMEDLESSYNALPRNKLIILYCKSGGTGIRAAKELFDKGFCTKALVGGIDEYKGKYLV